MLTVNRNKKKKHPWTSEALFWLFLKDVWNMKYGISHLSSRPCLNMEIQVSLPNIAKTVLSVSWWKCQYHPPNHKVEEKHWIYHKCLAVGQVAVSKEGCRSKGRPAKRCYHHSQSNRKAHLPWNTEQDNPAHNEGHCQRHDAVSQYTQALEERDCATQELGVKSDDDGAEPNDDKDLGWETIWKSTVVSYWETCKLRITFKTTFLWPWVPWLHCKKKKKGSSSWKKFENPPLVNSYFLLF